MRLGIVVALALISLGTPARAELPTPYVSADQGGTYHAPENTMVAMRNGIRLGADELETDLNITADGELVLLHDGWLDRTTDCTGVVHLQTLAEIRGCD